MLIVEEDIADAYELICYPVDEVQEFLDTLGINFGSKSPIDAHIRDRVARRFGKMFSEYPVQDLSVDELVELNNLTNMPEDYTTLQALEEVSGEEGYKEEYVKQLTLRDQRDYREREFPLDAIIEAVENDSIRPALVFELENKRYLIDGRTRVYAAVAADKSMKVRIINAEKFRKDIV